MLQTVPVTARRIATWALAALAVVACAWFGAQWFAFRLTRSISQDAFIESHLVNVAPQVEGEVVEVFVQEQQSVKKGQLLAIVDPRTYTRAVELEAARRDLAAAGLAKAEADLALLSSQVPQRVAEATARLSMARSAEASAAAALAMTRQDVDQDIDAAAKAVVAADAVLAFAAEDLGRFDALYRDGTASERRYQDAVKEHATADADKRIAMARLRKSEANRAHVTIAEQTLASSRDASAAAEAALELERLGDVEIDAARQLVAERGSALSEAEQALRLAELQLEYTKVVAPFEGIVAKKWRHLGDYAHAGDALFSVYSPELLYVTVQLEETRLQGVSPGCRAILHVDAFDEPFSGRVLWVGSATGANFSLIPRDVASGEFTYVVQRVPTRIAIDRDDRWAMLKPGLSVTVDIEHGEGDAEWAAAALAEEAAAASIRREAAR